MEKELAQFGEYLSDPGSENAKDYLVFPLFKKLFGSKFRKQADAEGADIYQRRSPLGMAGILYSL